MAMMVMLSTAATTSQAISSRRTRRLSPLSPQQDPRRSQPKEFPSEGESHVESMSFKIQLTHTNESSNIASYRAPLGGRSGGGGTDFLRPSVGPSPTSNNLFAVSFSSGGHGRRSGVRSGRCNLTKRQEDCHFLLSFCL
jgi:hypothetical protein